MEDTDKKIIKVNVSALKPMAKDALIYSVCAFLCAYASLPYGITPLGISVCAGKQKNILRYVALYVGALSAALVSGRPFYAAAIVFTCPFRILLEYFIPRRKHALIAPLNAAVSLALCFALEYFQYGMLKFDLVSGIIACAVGIYFAVRFKEAAETLAVKQYDGEVYPLILLISVCIISISSFEVYGINAGVFAAAVITLFFSEDSRTGTGCVAALLCGVCALLNNTGKVSAVTALCISSLVFSRAKIKNKAIRLLYFDAVFCFSLLFFDFDNTSLILMAQVSAAAGLYMLIPEKYISSLQERLGLKASNEKIPGIKNLVCNRLKRAKKSMEKIAESLKTKTHGGTMDVYAKVNDTVENICRDCRRAPVCWGEEYSATKDVFNKAANKLIKTGSFKDDFLPDYFKNYCLKKDMLYTELTQIALLYSQNTIFSRTINANRLLLAEQYEGIGAYIKEICDEISAVSNADKQTDLCVKEYLSSIGVPQNVSVYRDGLDALHLDISIKADSKLYESRIVKDISDILGRDMTAEHFEYNGSRYEIRLIQKEKYSVMVAQVNKNKSGENVCGDSFVSFRSSGYKQVLALADGMGSGENAERLSTLALDILKNLLENGFNEDKACSLVNSSLLLGGDGQSFSTLDMTSINLFNGHTDFYKLGAAPTIIIRQNKAYEVFSRTLPAGIVEDASADHKSCRLKSGDTLVMFSDGVEVTEKMLGVCRNFSSDTPLNLCRRLLEISTDNEKAADDITVAVAKLDNKISAKK